MWNAEWAYLAMTVLTVDDGQLQKRRSEGSKVNSLRRTDQPVPELGGTDSRRNGNRRRAVAMPGNQL